MKKKKVISRDNLPTRTITIWPVLTAIMALDHWHAAQWMWWVSIGLLVLMYTVVIAQALKEDQVDLFEEENVDTKINALQGRLDELEKQRSTK